MALSLPPQPDPALSPERRKELGAFLKSIPGVVKTYFQPPEDVKLDYPCIIYVQDDLSTSYADNKPYRNAKRYLLTVIDQNPDSLIPNVVAAQPYSAFVRRFETQGLHHTLYSLYF